MTGFGYMRRSTKRTAKMIEKMKIKLKPTESLWAGNGTERPV